MIEVIIRRRQRKPAPIESTTDLIKLFDKHNIKVGFVVEDPQRRGMALTVVGVPRYAGFNIDVGEMFEVGDRSLATHDFERIEIRNPDFHRGYDTIARP